MRLSLILCCLWALSAPLAAETAAVTDDGTLLQVQLNAYGDLFPGSRAIAPRNRVIALDVTRPSGATVRHLVPGTEGPEVEREPTLVWDGGQAFLLWSSGTLSRSTLQLAGFDGVVWSRAIEVSGDTHPLKGPPRMVLTRDPYQVDEGEARRLIVHIVWWEEDQSTLQVLYTPIVLVDGQYLGWNPVIELDAFDKNAEVASVPDQEALFRAADIFVGSDDRSVVIALPQQRTNRLLTLHVAVQPSGLLELADETFEHLVTFGASLGSRASILALADAARSHIIGVGLKNPSRKQLFRGVRSYIASEVYIALLAAGSSFEPNQLDALASLAWRTTIASGATILGHGLSAEEPDCALLHLGVTPEVSDRSRHQIEVCLASDRPAPVTSTISPHTLFTSANGEDVLVAWVENDGSIRYRLSEEAAWSAILSIARRPGMTVPEALHLLRRQVRVD